MILLTLLVRLISRINLFRQFYKIFYCNNKIINFFEVLLIIILGCCLFSEEYSIIDLKIGPSSTSSLALESFNSRKTFISDLGAISELGDSEYDSSLESLLYPVSQILTYALRTSY